MHSASRLLVRPLPRGPESHLSIPGPAQSQRFSSQGSQSQRNEPSSFSDQVTSAIGAVAKRLSEHEHTIVEQGEVIKRLEAKLDTSLENEAALRDQLAQHHTRLEALEELKRVPETLKTLVAGFHTQMQDALDAQAIGTRQLLQAELGRFRSSLLEQPSPGPAVSSAPASLHPTSRSQAVAAISPSSLAQPLASPPAPPSRSGCSTGNAMSGRRTNQTVGARKRKLPIEELPPSHHVTSQPSASCARTTSTTSDPSHRHHLQAPRARPWCTLFDAAPDATRELHDLPFVAAEEEEEEEEEDADGGNRATNKAESEAQSGDLSSDAEALDLFEDDGHALADKPCAAPPLLSPPSAVKRPSPSSGSSSRYTPFSVDLAKEPLNPLDYANLAPVNLFTLPAATIDQAKIQRTFGPSATERRDFRLGEPARRQALHGMRGENA